jgi:hypothetical protein
MGDFSMVETRVEMMVMVGMKIVLRSLVELNYN